MKRDSNLKYSMLYNGEGSCDSYGTLKNLNNTADNSGPAIIWYKNDYR